MRLSKARRECVTAMMKDTIYDAASSLLEQHGTDGLTMDRVAKKVGVATASLYNYFRDKDDLLQFFYTRLAEPCFLAMEEIAKVELPAPQKLVSMLRTALRYAIEHKGFLRLLAGMDFESEIRTTTRPRLLRIFEAVFEQGIREGYFRPHNPTHTSRMFLGCFSELFDLRAIGGSDEEATGFVEAVVDAILNGFHAEKTVSSDKETPRSSNP